MQIDYTSPTFLIPQRVRFRYRLDGYDHDWHEAGTRRQAFYTDLPPGKYSFRVIASNSDGVWNDNAARLDFTVTPAYYQTNWFRILCALVFLGLLWAAYRWRVRQMRHEFEVTLDARVGERTRIARELQTLIGGKLTIWSEVDAGTEVELRVPASIAYATARRRSWLSQAFAAKAKG